MKMGMRKIYDNIKMMEPIRQQYLTIDVLV